MPDLDALGAQYREAKAAVGEHRKIENDIDLDRIAWLRRHRGVPSHLLYDRQTGEPTDPELVAFEAALAAAHADTEWCKGLVIACGEAFKGIPFDEATRGAGD